MKEMKEMKTTTTPSPSEASKWDGAALSHFEAAVDAWKKGEANLTASRITAGREFALYVQARLKAGLKSRKVATEQIVAALGPLTSESVDVSALMKGAAAHDLLVLPISKEIGYEISLPWDRYRDGLSRLVEFKNEGTPQETIQVIPHLDRVKLSALIQRGEKIAEFRNECAALARAAAVRAAEEAAAALAAEKGKAAQSPEKVREARMEAEAAEKRVRKLAPRPKRGAPPAGPEAGDIKPGPIGPERAAELALAQVARAKPIEPAIRHLLQLLSQLQTLPVCYRDACSIAIESIKKNSAKSA